MVGKQHVGKIVLLGNREVQFRAEEVSQRGSASGLILHPLIPDNDVFGSAGFEEYVSDANVKRSRKRKFEEKAKEEETKGQSEVEENQNPFATLRKRLNSRGYLFLRNIIDDRDVNAAYEKTMDFVEEQRRKKKDTTYIPFMEGYTHLNHSPEVLSVIESPSLYKLFRGLLYAGYTADDLKGPVRNKSDTGPSNRIDPPRQKVPFASSNSFTAPPNSNRTKMRRVESTPVAESGEGGIDFRDRKILTFDYKWLRAVGPGACTGCHVDSVYMNRGTTQLLTCWIPLQKINLDLGGLAVLGNSNSCPALQKVRDTYGRFDVENADAAMKKTKKGNFKYRFDGTGWLTSDPLDVYREGETVWRTCSEYKPGDVVIFTQHTMHMSLANCSKGKGRDALRVSCDTRWQRATEAVDPRYVVGNPESVCSKPSDNQADDVLVSKFGLHATDSPTRTDSPGKKDVAGDKCTAKKSSSKNKEIAVTITELRKMWGI